MGIEDVIPTRSSQTAHENFDKEKYRSRNIVERATGWIKEFRRAATRYDNKVENYLAMVHIAICRKLLKCIDRDRA
ncbi:MAG: transposase [Planctomicrobium sp.]|nr:transposase [Planctomicrobium sp.]